MAGPKASYAWWSFEGRGADTETLLRESAAMGYDGAQLDALRATLDAAPADVIVSGTPIEKITKGPALSSDMKEMIAKAKPGQKVYIEGIKAKGPDGTIRSLGSLAFKVV